MGVAKMDEPPNLSADAFAGTAEVYLRYRPPYPRALLTDLIERAGVRGDARLLDLACGPGRVALALAAAFESVWAVDLEPEMIEAGRREAARLGVGNLTWVVGPAEDLAAPSGVFDLITIGEAFHRLDQPRILENAMRWLRPGGCLASLGGVGLLNGAEPWQITIADIARRRTARAFPRGWAASRPGAAVSPEQQAQLMREAGFEAVASHRFSTPHEWTLETIVGYLESTSVCSRRLLGEAFEGFEQELRAALLDHDVTGRYREDLAFGFTIARKPQ